MGDQGTGARRGRDAAGLAGGGARSAVVRYSCAYLLPWKDHLIGRLESAGVPTRCLRGGQAADPRWALQLRRSMRDDPVDVAHFHSPYVAAIGRLVVAALPRRIRPAIVTTEHNVWWSFAWPTRVLNALTAPLDQARIAVSDDVRQSMWPGWRRRTRTVMHGVVPEEVRAQGARRTEIRGDLGIAEDQVVCCTVANYRAQKDYPTLLRAAKMVVDADPNVRFVAVGQGPLEGEVTAEHERLGLGDRFILTGYREDAVAIMAAADLFVLSSAHEGLPVALMEAMTLGLPIVSTAVGGIPAVVTDGVEGRLVPAADPVELSQAVLQLASGDRHEMAVASRRASEPFDIRTAGETLERMYQRLPRPAALRR